MSNLTMKGFLGQAAAATAGRTALRPTRQPAQSQTQNPDPTSSRKADPSIESIVAQLVKYRKRVPVYLLSSGLEAGVIPVDTEAEVGRSVVSHLLSEGEMSPAGAISASATGTGTIELTAPANSGEIIVPALVLEFATTTNDSQPGPITGSIAAAYTGAPKFLNTAGVHTLRARGAGYENYDFQSGVFQVTPRVLGEKHTMVIFPYQVVNSRTYLRPLSLAEAMVRFAEASTIRLSITGAPSGLLTTLSVLTVQAPVYKDVLGAVADAD